MGRLNPCPPKGELRLGFTELILKFLKEQKQIGLVISM